MEMQGRISAHGSRFIILTVALGALMGSLDISIVNISIPSITRHFDASTSLASWVIIIYLLVLTGSLPAFGKIGDMKGFRSVFVTGFGIFTAGSLLCGCAGSMGELILFRALQAIGGAMISAVGPAIITTYVPRSERGGGIGLVATFASLGIALGPPVGGLITSFLGWQWIFLLNVPVGIAGMLVAMRVVPDRVPERRDVRFDAAGTVLIVLALASLLLALSQGNEIGWSSSLIIGLFIVSVSLWCAFLLRERRYPDPLVDLSLFRNHAFTLANTATLLIKMVFTGTIFLFPFYFELVKGYDTHIVGLLLTVPAIAMMATGPVAGRISDRVGSRPLCALGAVTGAVVFAAFALMTETIGMFLIVGALALRGIAGGLFMAPNRSLILGHSPPDRQGVAASLMKTIGNSGSAVGIAVFETIFAEAIAFGGAMEVVAIHETVDAATLSAGFALIFTVAVVLCCAAAVLSALANDPVPAVSARLRENGEGIPGDERCEGPADPLPATGSRS